MEEGRHGEVGMMWKYMLRNPSLKQKTLTQGLLYVLLKHHKKKNSGGLSSILSPKGDDVGEPLKKGHIANPW